MPAKIFDVQKEKQIFWGEREFFSFRLKKRRLVETGIYFNLQHGNNWKWRKGLVQNDETET